jgi:hypothetical protein
LGRQSVGVHVVLLGHIPRSRICADLQAKLRLPSHKLHASHSDGAVECLSRRCQSVDPPRTAGYSTEFKWMNAPDVYKFFHKLAAMSSGSVVKNQRIAFLLPELGSFLGLGLGNIARIDPPDHCRRRAGAPSSSHDKRAPHSCGKTALRTCTTNSRGVKSSLSRMTLYNFGRSVFGLTFGARV